jgi:polyvinyl alcohol dehydrogenase (cytochrome)
VALLAALVVLAAACSSAGGSGAGDASATTVHRDPGPGRWDWPTYGHDAQHTFAGRTTLTRASAARLQQAWFFPTGDAVTATPTVVHGTVYVGSWDTKFYAIDLATGRLRWSAQLKRQDAVTPYPGEAPRDDSSDGGLVTSSAWYEPGVGRRPDLVIFGGGYTLYALDAHDGHVYWSHDYTGRPDQPADPAHDEARIFSSPIVVDGRVVFAVDTDGQSDHRGYVAAASLATGQPLWVHQTDMDTSGHLLNDGCGNVWSSPTLLPADGLVVMDVADCNFSNPPPTSESVIALRVRDGSLAWQYRPTRHDEMCDLDFGATANAGVDADGHATFLGVGAKDGTYYSLDPKTGALRWSTNVVFGGFSGGFIATTAYDGKHVFGSTALGDFGRFESNGNQLCDPSNPRDVAFQQPTVHAFDAATGKVLWQVSNAASFAPTTVAGGLTFNGLGLSKEVDVRDAATGALIVKLSVSAFPWSGVATVGDAVVFGTGASEQGSPDGVEVFTPDGATPAVPAS